MTRKIDNLLIYHKLFFQVCTLSASEESAKKLAIKEREECLQELVELRAIAEAHDDVIQQFHLLLAANHQGDATSRQIFNDMVRECCLPIPT